MNERSFCKVFVNIVDRHSMTRPKLLLKMFNLLQFKFLVTVSTSEGDFIIYRAAFIVMSS
jgi:hypothetical protein